MRYAVKWFWGAWLLLLSLPLHLRGQQQPLPIRGSWINLFYQDERNRYTNPAHVDGLDPELWRKEVRKLYDMGMDYIVLMAVANKGMAYYPSQCMPRAYPDGGISPVEAIMKEAETCGMRVFLSTGWAKNQDDNLRNPEIRDRQLEILHELALLYNNSPALYGWYLPVEDCLGPILSDRAVEAVNSLTAEVRRQSPGKKVLISPYGLFKSRVNYPHFAEQIARLTVDIIAYQDEVGCLREPYPLPNLKEKWKALRAIHDQLPIALWANCESFTWEGTTNDRHSPLLPASPERILAQQAAATQGGAECILSFAISGLVTPADEEDQLGQPGWSAFVHQRLQGWRQECDRSMQLLGASLMEKLKSTVCPQSFLPNKEMLFDGFTAELTPADRGWVSFRKGKSEIKITLKEAEPIHEVMIRLLESPRKRVTLPRKILLYTSTNGHDYTLAGEWHPDGFSNARHDSRVCAALFQLKGVRCRYLKLCFEADDCHKIDEIYLNPILQ